jgi:F-type H+-transporting ATPase subunit b
MPTLLLAEAGANPVNVEWLTLVTTIVIFLIFFGVAAVFIWPKILTGLDEREQKIHSEIERAEAARAEAAEDALRLARVEANEMIAKARGAAEDHAKEMRERAEEELNSLRMQAHREIDTAREAAVKDLTSHAASLSTAIAGRILGREITDNDQRDLIDQSLKEFASAHEG